MAEGLLRPPSSLSLLLMERANLANETRALKRPLMRGTNREESVYVQWGHCALSWYTELLLRSLFTSLTLKVHHKKACVSRPLQRHSDKRKTPTLQVTLGFDTSHAAGNYFISSHF